MSIAAGELVAGCTTAAAVLPLASADDLGIRTNTLRRFPHLAAARPCTALCQSAGGPLAGLALTGAIGDGPCGHAGCEEGG